MLTYLNNDKSNANSPQGVNVNFGRELLELHTLGIDEAGNQIYAESDVRGAALAMSGWSIQNNRSNADYTDFVFRDNFHQTAAVSILNGAWSSGATTGKATGESLLDFLASHPSTARHIAYKICRRFVADSPPAGLVASTAQVFLDNQTQLVPTLRHVFSSPEFAASEGQKLRRPIEGLVAALRALEAQLPDDPVGRSATQLRTRLMQQGHEPWAWEQPNGFPDRAGHWLTADGLLNRWNVSARLARNAESAGAGGDQIVVGYGSFRPAAANLGELITKLGQRFGLGQLPSASVAAIATAIRANPSDAVNASFTDDRLADIIGLLLAHPLFQTR